MSGRTLYIEDHDDESCPVTGCGCDWKGTVATTDPVTDGALTPGDPSPSGRCPECDGLVYLDRPLDRATDALRHLIWLKARGYPPGDSNLERAADALQSTLSQALGGAVVVTLPQQ